MRLSSGGFALLFAGCALAAALTVSAAIAQTAPGGLTVSEQWFRLIMPSLPAAGYFTLSNATATPRTLVGAASPACGALMLHQSVGKNGEERMVMISSLAVPAHGEVRFAPGGYHLMCMSPGPAMKPGRSVPVTLRLADGETVEASFPVRGATGR
jgi:hypothetical protein